MRGIGPAPTSFSDERRDELIEAVARRIEALGLSTPAILMLEAHKPLSFVSSQALLVLQPLLSFALDAETSRECSELLEESANVDRLIQRLERQATNGDRTAA